ncbi:MAG: DUF1553 domain-containing protein, partial [Planctomycetaceae bacterium]|nr:DUF1553 domain-containing protein [Planctomycetaceae bacterium]
PELLDWLAHWFMQEGWSLKKLHRLIVTSGTFCQSSQELADPAVAAKTQQIDPDNRLLWRMNAHRLSFEEMRDSMLKACDALDSSVGGKPVNLFTEPFPVRRTLYGLIDRQFLPGTLRMFDFANPDLHIPQRSDTTVPQQALFLMNHPSSLQQSHRLAELANAADESSAARVSLLYQQVLQRTPTADEMAIAIAFLEQPATEPTRQAPATAADWSYGYGRADEELRQVADFQPLPHFTGQSWQGGPAWPDAKLGWVQLTATGGHPGNDRNHASVRRWTAPRDMLIKVTSQVVHEAAPGDGIRTFIVSSKAGILQQATLHQQTVDLNVEERNVTKGETIDFVCDIGDVLNSDQHFWRIQIAEAASAPTAETASTVTWNSELDFPITIVNQLTPLQQLAQVLLCSNEFLFVD